MRTKSDGSDFVQLASHAVTESQSTASTAPTITDTPVDPHVQHALIVDDNPINRRLLAAWMKRHKIPFKETKDGQQALDAYKDLPHPALPRSKFDLILMDISMPVMDGMTSTRLIREHEKKEGWTPCHIIALTGLTSASAKLEAWTSGVDDFLTKPVDFKKLGTLMEVGRGGEGTGFLQEQGSLKTRKNAKGLQGTPGEEVDRAES
jgi:CheY-like chemotaxis protein